MPFLDQRSFVGAAGSSALFGRARSAKADDTMITVPTEEALHARTSVRFVASHATYHTCNGAIIGAEFGDPRTDEIARTALSRHYPDREIVTLDVDPLGELGGGIHCAIQQMPG